MRISRLFSPTPIARDRALPQEHCLEGQAAHYLQHVLRSRPDDELVIFDGLGGEFQARVLAHKRHTTIVELLSHLAEDRATEHPFRLGLALLRGDRMDYALRKATELGVTHIQLLRTERCEVNPSGSKLDKRLQHWRGVTYSACEQCGLNLPPELSAPCSLAQWLSHSMQGCKLVLHPTGRPGVLTGSSATARPNGFVLATGPEGGFSEQEMAMFEEQGFLAWSLGPRILRAETAPIVALAIAQHWTGELG